MNIYIYYKTDVYIPYILYYYGTMHYYFLFVVVVFFYLFIFFYYSAPRYSTDLAQLAQ